MTKEVKLNYYRHNISPGDTRSKLEKAKEQYYIRSTMHQPYEARQALWKVRMYERQLYNPGACIIDKEGTDFVSPHPLTRLQDLSAFLGGPKIDLPIKDDWDDVEPEFARVMREVLPELADCFPSYKIVQQSAKGKNISPKALQEAYKRAVRKKGQNTTKMAVRRDRHVKEILESAYVIELATGGADKLKKLIDDPQFASDLRAFLKRVPPEQLDKLEYEVTELKKALDARQKTHAAVKKGVKKKAAKGPSPGKTAFDKKLAQTKRYLSSYHARRYWTHRANKLNHADAHQKAMSETRDKAGASLRDNLWYHPAGHYEISNHLRLTESLYSGKNKPPKPKAKK